VPLELENLGREAGPDVCKSKQKNEPNRDFAEGVVLRFADRQTLDPIVGLPTMGYDRVLGGRTPRALRARVGPRAPLGTERSARAKFARLNKNGRKPNRDVA
jgi:hypothetical protein